MHFSTVARYVHEIHFQMGFDFPEDIGHKRHGAFQNTNCQWEPICIFRCQFMSKLFTLFPDFLFCNQYFFNISMHDAPPLLFHMSIEYMMSLSVTVQPGSFRSEERRVGTEGRSGRSPDAGRSTAETHGWAD